MTTLRHRTARSAVLSGAALAFGLFASIGIAGAGTDGQAAGRAATQGQSASVEQSAEKPVSRIRRNRQMGFGRRGGDR